MFNWLKRWKDDREQIMRLQAENNALNAQLTKERMQCIGFDPTAEKLLEDVSTRCDRVTGELKAVASLTREFVTAAKEVTDAINGQVIDHIVDTKLNSKLSNAWRREVELKKENDTLTAQLEVARRTIELRSKPAKNGHKKAPVKKKKAR